MERLLAGNYLDSLGNLKQETLINTLDLWTFNVKCLSGKQNCSMPQISLLCLDTVNRNIFYPSE